jgi:hypothetical protein
MPGHQLALFSAASRPVPEGFSYRSAVISPDEEKRLLAEIASLPFKEF